MQTGGGKQAAVHGGDPLKMRAVHAFVIQKSKQWSDYEEEHVITVYGNVVLLKAML